jgi:ribonuclease P protein component
VQRLKTRAQFQSVLAGTVIAKTPHFALHCTRLEAQASGSRSQQAADPVCLFPVQDVWMGAMVPKRWAKRAVTRNAIKRQIYTVSADFSPLFPNAAFVVRLRSGFAVAQFVSAVSDQLKLAVRTEIQVLMQAGARSA